MLRPPILTEWLVTTACSSTNPEECWWIDPSESCALARLTGRTSPMIIRELISFFTVISFVSIP